MSGRILWQCPVSRVFRRDTVESLGSVRWFEALLRWRWGRLCRLRAQRSTLRVGKECIVGTTQLVIAFLGGVYAGHVTVDPYRPMASCERKPRLDRGKTYHGIVTKFTYKTVPQGHVWGGTLNYNVDQLDLVKEALVKFQQKNDTKAALNVPRIYTQAGAISATVVFYNAPTLAPRIFDDFLAIPTNQSDVKTRSFADMFNSLSFINSPNSVLSINGNWLMERYSGRLNGISVTQYSPPVFDAFVNQTLFWGGKIRALDPNAIVVLTLEPFLKDVFSHSPASAYPPDRSRALFPTAAIFAYNNASLGDTVNKGLRSYSDAATAAVVADGQNVSHAAVCPNYALFDTLLGVIYGENLPWLHGI
ncbi:hypothetical protein EDB87DRAFT_1580180 [Lactarius vividus]|nr:hypothetical protein EDB87DRAFT_1580180 [Lactarius vividus]